MDTQNKIAELIYKKLKGDLSEKEQTELQIWMDEKPANRKLHDKITASSHLLEKFDVYKLFNREDVWENLDKELFESNVVKFNAAKWYRYAAAIAIPIIALGGIFYFLNQGPAIQNLKQADQYIKPGTQRATLILADGNEIVLDAKDSPTEINQKDAKIINEKNQLTYEATEELQEEAPLIYNQLATPRGGTYNLSLSDGTKVWLNAESSLKYPTAFTDSTRQVFLVGEAYFDVAKGAKPFIVSSDAQDIQVLGTQFNITAYPDETITRTTLVEGSIAIAAKDEQGNPISRNLLTPDDQSIVDNTTDEIRIEKVDPSRYTSWVSGKFEFDEASLEMVMKRLSRWYAFEYRFDRENAKNYHFSGRIQNDESISAILEMLKLTTDVKFEIQETTIVIL